jgi:hypothetical protein
MRVVLDFRLSKLPKIIWEFEILAQKSVSVSASLTACTARSRVLHHVVM